jgi:hypothetical protein
MQGALKIAHRVPMKALPGRYGNQGGSIDVELPADLPLADGYMISFNSYFTGKVYALSQPFAIVDALPSNYTTPTGLVAATHTAVITGLPSPLQQWPLELNGPKDKLDDGKLTEGAL